MQVAIPYHKISTLLRSSIPIKGPDEFFMFLWKMVLNAFEKSKYLRIARQDMKATKRNNMPCQLLPKYCKIVIVRRVTLEHK